MINRAVIIGRLTKDPDLRTTGNGLSVVQFTVAVDRQFTDANGKRGADFINCVAWRKNAENISKYFSKGNLIGVDGRIQTRSYDNQAGQRVYVTEVVIDSWCFLEPKHSKEEQANNWEGQKHTEPATSKPKTSFEDPFAGKGDTIDITNDDLPF